MRIESDSANISEGKHLDRLVECVEKASSFVDFPLEDLKIARPHLKDKSSLDDFVEAKKRGDVNTLNTSEKRLLLETCGLLALTSPGEVAKKFSIEQLKFIAENLKTPDLISKFTQDELQSIVPIVFESYVNKTEKDFLESVPVKFTKPENNKNSSLPQHLTIGDPAELLSYQVVKIYTFNGQNGQPCIITGMIREKESDSKHVSIVQMNVSCPFSDSLSEAPSNIVISANGSSEPVIINSPINLISGVIIVSPIQLS